MSISFFDGEILIYFLVSYYFLYIIFYEPIFLLIVTLSFLGSCFGSVKLGISELTEISTNKLPSELGNYWAWSYYGSDSYSWDSFLFYRK